MKSIIAFLCAFFYSNTCLAFGYGWQYYTHFKSKAHGDVIGVVLKLPKRYDGFSLKIFTTSFCNYQKNGKNVEISRKLTPENSANGMTFVNVNVSDYCKSVANFDHLTYSIKFTKGVDSSSDFYGDDSPLISGHWKWQEFVTLKKLRGGCLLWIKNPDESDRIFSIFSVLRGKKKRVDEVTVDALGSAFIHLDGISGDEEIEVYKGDGLFFSSK
ncbi:hypothetical protein [Gallaecimonas pentaromativorans]|uniref:Uncharacterized protein n=1 Tax=Gallaecimonas pentaromativorans TaxID=584787 RepID=A0A3N1P6N0_9GAMM|nr:hypothetical protein [Gallaecimonas pentaromativorans]MED5525233.1 hypothetical protein [Pseudomonadota bacterium]ROQ24195.1 hypothetical protein EDC28_10776 [Gallaecimonas pentaromativorans]